MYTQCPACGTVFAVTGEQLDVAGGRVRCGACRTPFDALLYLVQHLPEAPPAMTGRGPRTGIGGPGPARTAEPGARPQEPGDRPSTRGTEAVDAAGRYPTPTEGGSPAPDRPVGRGVAPAVAGPAARAEAPGPGASTDDAPRPGGRVPEALRADLALASRRRRHWTLRALGLAFMVVLVGLLAFQIAWLAPRELLARAPVARPWIERLAPTFDRASTALGWERPAPRDLGRIRVRDRDIREHPQYPGALLVQATLVNDAPFPQPPPRVRLTLFDVNGAVLAQRVFLPSEYLADAEASPVAGEGVPWQLRLELVAPAAPAVSYQIEFI